MDRFIIRKPRTFKESREKPAKKKVRLSDIEDRSIESVSSAVSIKSESEDTPETELSVLPEGSSLFDDGEAGLIALESSIQFDEAEVVGDLSIKPEKKKGSAKKEYDDTEDTKEHESLWVKGQRSLYVDAFTLTLDTVLTDESHLFDEKELEVFRQWRMLDYQEKYLYVRLFLRKTLAWHRIYRLEYHNDVTDLDGTIQTLERTREFQLPSKNSESKRAEDSREKYDARFEASFTFAESSTKHITTIEDATSLLSLDELKSLAKEVKALGKNKPELRSNLIRATQEQASLLSMGVTQKRSSNIEGNNLESADNDTSAPTCRKQEMLEKIAKITGPCTRLSRQTVKLFERVHLVFYRSNKWTEKSLTTIILAKISQRNFPEYIVHRSAAVFSSRTDVIEFEAALRLQSDVDKLLETGSAGFMRLVEILDAVYPCWKVLIEHEQKRKCTFEDGESAYIRRFSPTHVYTRIVHKGAHVLGRLKNYAREYNLVCELLEQRLFHTARRGSWYQRKALLEEHYMYSVELANASISKMGSDVLKKKWKNQAIETCEQALQDNDCHVIFHYDLQKRLVKLERQLRIPKRLQHDFGHVSLRVPLQHTVEGIQLKPESEIDSKSPSSKSTRTWWLDELGSDPEATVTVEEMALSWYRKHGGWKGYHAEGGIVRTLFAYLFYDILFLPVANVFQTAFQSCPLDLFTDTFYATRAGEINRRLAVISNGGGNDLVSAVLEREGPRRTCVIGLNWDFSPDDILQLIQCFPPAALAAMCTILAQDYRMRCGGMPDLLLWRERSRPKCGDGDGDGEADYLLQGVEMLEDSTFGECMFVEVKSANDRVSDTQRLWMHVLGTAGVPVAVCQAVAREVRIV
ncbi:Fanconi-associated nuclease 1-like protein [Ceratocystis lukuohia]|uniref:Fanconi-associated nuclease n=1 Tax=Ceratocystis lukuohia TaxID=2019550 RepID=A0ABR4MAZ1_9PEZI